MKQRLSSRRTRREAQVIWAAAYILLGLRFSPVLAAQLFRGVVTMKESSTYQAILAEGRAEGRTEGRTEGAIAEAKRVLRLQGDDAFGPPDARLAAAIERLNDLTRLEELLKRVRTAESWQQLLGQSPPGPRGRRRPPSP
jgi:predicted transposase YdaD